MLLHLIPLIFHIRFLCGFFFPHGYKLWNILFVKPNCGRQSTTLQQMAGSRYPLNSYSKALRIPMPAALSIKPLSPQGLCPSRRYIEILEIYRYIYIFIYIKIFIFLGRRMEGSTAEVLWLAGTPAWWQRTHARLLGAEWVCCTLALPGKFTFVEMSMHIF